MRLLDAFLFLLLISSCWAQSKVTIKGVATGCQGGERFYSSGLDVFVYGIDAASELLTTLKELDSIGSDPGGKRYTQLDRKLAELVERIKPDVTFKTDLRGRFEAELDTPARPVLVLGYAVTDEGAERAYQELLPEDIGKIDVILNFTPDFPLPQMCPVPRRR